MKKTVHYSWIHPHIVIGQSLNLVTTDHPGKNIINGRQINTSLLEKGNWETGVFETENTIYIPEELK